MKQPEFFYLQYDKINWELQEKTLINQAINEHIVQTLLLPLFSSDISKNQSIYDIGCGIGFFLKICQEQFPTAVLHGCEPSNKNYLFAKKHTDFIIENVAFNNANLRRSYKAITAIYVFPHILFYDLCEAFSKINNALEKSGFFILVVANQEYISQKLVLQKDLCIEKSNVTFNKKSYTEFLHYSHIPQIGTIIDYNRDEQLYIDLATVNNFILEKKEDFMDNGFICTIFVFKKL